MVGHIMQKGKKSKKETIEKLRMILDNPSTKDPFIKDEAYLNALQKRLAGPSKESYVYVHEGFTEKSDSLNANITIHRREKNSFVTPEPEHMEPGKPKIEEQKENLFEDEELYEVEKVEIDIPEFVEVKPKDTVKTEEIPADMEGKEIHEIDDELPEWEPVEPKEVKIEEETKEKKPETLEEIPEWEPISIEETGGDLPTIKKPEKEREIPQKPTIEHDKKIDVFEDIESINEKTALLLHNNGFKSIDDLSDASLKDLTRIKGIKRRLAKKIKRDVKKKVDETIVSKYEPLKQEEETSKKPTKISHPKKDRPIVETEVLKDAEPTEVLQKEGENYRYKGYTLYRKEIKLGSDKKRTIRFFSKEKPDDGKPVQLPDSYEVKVNRKTGVPYIRRKK